MVDTNERLRSEENTSNAAQTINSHTDAADGPAPGATSPERGTASPSKPKGRSHPTVISGRVSHSTKGRAKDIARTRGISLCQLVREAVQRAVRTHEKSPDAV
jgi:hypothetical protein